MEKALSLNLTERRLARDGEAYTFAQYADFYGFQSALTLWQTRASGFPSFPDIMSPYKYS